MYIYIYYYRLAYFAKCDNDSISTYYIVYKSKGYATLSFDISLPNLEN